MLNTEQLSALNNVGVGVYLSADDRDSVSNFVASLTYGADPFYMSVEDAAICILEWTAEGVEIPLGLTPHRLSATWNRYMFG